MSTSDHYFEQLYQSSTDPWGFRERWYEQRKRDLILASLAKPRYQRIFEPGCSNAELSYQLALRAERLCCCDTSLRAVELARRKTADMPHVDVAHARLPEQWPTGAFDLIVLSELCYYLNRQDCLALIERINRSLTDGGEVLACHWRPTIAECPMTGDQVHQMLHAHLALTPISRHEEASFVLEIWAADGRSVAEREGLLGSAACWVY